MSTLAQNNSEVPKGAVSDNISYLQQLHVFQFGHSTGRPQLNHNKYMYMYFNNISMYFNSTVQCANTVLLLSCLLQCISLHYYALLLFVKPRPDGIQMAHNLGAKLFIYLVSVSTEAGHIGSTAPVCELFINEYCFTVMFCFYL